MKVSKVKKIVFAIFILAITIGISTISRADFDVYEGETPKYTAGGHWKPTEEDGGILYCIQYGGSFNSGLTTISRAEYQKWKAQGYIPAGGGYVCSKCDPGLEGQLPWTGVKKFIRYKAGETIDYASHQDEAYNLADYEEKGLIMDMMAQYATWASTVSDPMVPSIFGKEGTAYMQFYNSIQGGFKVTDLTGTVNVGVNYKEGSYTVGPYKVSYPNGQYDGKNRFSWINKIEAVTDVGILNVEILDANGAPISGNIGRDGTQTLNEIDFYVKFYSKEALELNNVYIEFGYIHHCEAQMTAYEGHVMNVKWVKETGPDHIHKIPFAFPDEDGQIHTGELDVPYSTRRYKFTEEEAGDTQRLMLYTGTARKVVEKAEITLKGVALNPGKPDNPPEGVDLTMRLAGYVFLDKDIGKANTGNKVMDGDEALPGVEVYLRQVGGAEIARTHTDTNGYYEFLGINAQKKYYVEFVYNGMLYTNVERLAGNAEDISKATEEAQGNSGNRQRFNDQFAEIGSFPQNYKGRRVYMQEEIVDTFKSIAQNFGSHGSDEKSLYANDCRIHAYTTEVYPLIDVFTEDSQNHNIAGTNFTAIYSGEYDQLHINLGIATRSTFDMALYKDGFKADVVINEKTETYEYDARTDWEHKGFAIGISEGTYLDGMGKAYKGVTYADIENSLQLSRRDIETDTYDMDMRTEEVANGQSKSYNKENTKVYTEGTEKLAIDDNYTLNEEYDNLKLGVGENAQDRLKIFVTYKLAIRNQSSTVGAITEIVDYYDTNYNFVSAYVGNEDGTQNYGEVISSETSIYPNAQYKSPNDSVYKTIYLRPVNETRLSEANEQYIFITLQLVGPSGDVGTLLSNKLLNNNTLTAMNFAEINGYKTYYSKDGAGTPGLVDIDSNPGNFDLRKIQINSLADIEPILTNENSDEYKTLMGMYEDDTSRAPAYIYRLLESRTIEGQVFEDNTEKNDINKVYTNKVREGNGQLDKNDKPVEGAIVQLVEIKNNTMVVRSQTTTDKNGWYGFTGFLPGEYTIRYIYGADDNTAMTKNSIYKGMNERSYNGQDYQATRFNTNSNKAINDKSYAVDTIDYQDPDTGKTIHSLNTRYNNNNSEGAKNQETKLELKAQTIKKYDDNNYYWYADRSQDMLGKSDAYDDAARVSQVIDYSKNEYGREITNHKAEVFNSYLNPQPEHISNEKDRELANEFERRAYRYAYTPQIEIEVEKATETIGGSLGQANYKHNIVGVDFGIVERPKSELVIDQDIKDIKLTATDGTVLVDTANGIKDTVKWVKEDGKQYLIYGARINEYGKTEFITIDLDDELLSGAKLEVTYNITVTNNGEKEGTTRAKTILNYVANNLNFDVADNSGLWEVVKNEDIQTKYHSTFVNNSDGKDNLKMIDLSTQTTILKATDSNPLSKTSLKPGESVTSTLTLKKTLSAESSTDDLTYSNMSEIVEIDNSVGRYDRGAIPGNQKLNEQPQEHDTSGASRYAESDMINYPQDGKIVITPPTGSPRIYYVIGITTAVILLAGVILIKKFVVDKKK